MKVLVIYSSDSKKEVDKLRNYIAAQFGKSSVLRLHSTARKKSILPHTWHRDALRMMRVADLIVYAVSDASSTNKNVNWELNKALKLNKCIVWYPTAPGIVPKNPCLYDVDKNTKEEQCIIDGVKNKEELSEIIRDFNNNAYIKLFHEPVDKSILLEQYKIFLETAENLVERRQNVNSFYISANTAIITIGGTIFALGSDDNWMSKLAVIFALSIPGILLNVSWRKLLQSYYINNQGKLKILSMIEEKLAVSLFDAEWKAMKNKYSRNKYISFTDNEKTLTLVFLVFYILIDLICLVVFGLALFGKFNAN